MDASMDILTTALAALLCLAMIGAALLAVARTPGKAKDDDEAAEIRALPGAILAAGLVGLMASILYLILAAPDVAMTEAAIGSGLTTFLFFFVLARIRSRSAAPREDSHG